jgi:hypothetical protein
VGRHAGNPFAGYYKEFRVFNEGNVNMLNVRLAKSTLDGSQRFLPWPLTALANDPLGWFGGAENIHADLDRVFANSLYNNPQISPIIQKARVGDRTPTEMNVNPKTRENANLSEPGDTRSFLEVASDRLGLRSRCLSGTRWASTPRR